MVACLKDGSGSSPALNLRRGDQQSEMGRNSKSWKLEVGIVPQNFVMCWRLWLQPEAGALSDWQQGAPESSSETADLLLVMLLCPLCAMLSATDRANFVQALSRRLQRLPSRGEGCTKFRHHADHLYRTRLIHGMTDQEWDSRSTPVVQQDVDYFRQADFEF